MFFYIIKTNFVSIIKLKIRNLMIIKENIIKNKENNNVEYIEAVYDSSNILQTTYFPLKNKLYVSFKRGGVYSYLNITSEIYSEFKEASLCFYRAK